MPRKARRSGFGQIKERRMAAGVVYQASYNTPAWAFSEYRGLATRQYHTFKDLLQAQGWLAEQQRKIYAGIWTPPEVDKAKAEAQGMKFAEYADVWVANRHKGNGEPLSESTRTKYQELLKNHLLPFFGGMTVASILPKDVQRWWDSYAKPVAIRVKAYELLSSIMRSAENDPLNAQGDTLIERSPCRIKATLPPKKHRTINVEISELEKLYEAMPERLRLSIFLGGVMGLRIGEVLALRRCDVNLREKTLHVCGSVKVREIDGVQEVVRGTTKTPNSDRVLDIPEYLCPLIEKHLHSFVGGEKSAPLFPARRSGGFMRENSFNNRWGLARASVGLSDLRFHDLRHTALQRLVEHGASVNLVMAVAGHSTMATASVYQDNVSSSYRHDVMKRVNRQLLDELEPSEKDLGESLPSRGNPGKGEELGRLQSLVKDLEQMDLDTRSAVLLNLDKEKRSRVLASFSKETQIQTMTSLFEKEA